MEPVVTKKVKKGLGKRKGKAKANEDHAAEQAKRQKKAEEATVLADKKKSLKK